MPSYVRLAIAGVATAPGLSGRLVNATGITTICGDPPSDVWTPSKALKEMLTVEPLNALLLGSRSTIWRGLSRYALDQRVGSGAEQPDTEPPQDGIPSTL